MLILDTNVVAELMRPDPAAAVVRWLEAQLLTRLALTASPATRRISRPAA